MHVTMLIPGTSPSLRLSGGSSEQGEDNHHGDPWYTVRTGRERLDRTGETFGNMESAMQEGLVTSEP